MIVQNTSGKIKLHGTAKRWLFNKFTELINDFMCLLVNWDLMAGGGYIAFYEGKETVIFTSLKWKSFYFFSC